ncbi:DUF905 family protein [Escherichia coli]|uniref:DUF905 family protein n=1 Tax=Escherichia coli TaxID=562 RepID=UPI00123959CB|nr:DUF905 family protein [Escherichia coli]
MLFQEGVSVKLRLPQTAYRNVFIQDDPGMHFRRVIRNAEGQRRWRCRNSEPDAGKVLNTRLASDGLLRQ